MQNEYKKIYETYKSTGRTVKLDREIWDDIKKYLAVNYKEQEIKIDLADGSRKKLSDMNDAYEVILDCHEDIKKIEINAHETETKITVRYINTKEAFDDTFLVSLKISELEKMQTAREFAENIYKKTRLFSKAESLIPVGIIGAMLFIFYKLGLFETARSWAQAWAIIALRFIVLFFFSYLYLRADKVLKFEKGVQFWTDDNSAEYYEELNKRRREYSWLMPIIGVVVVLIAAVTVIL